MGYPRAVAVGLVACLECACGRQRATTEAPRDAALLELACAITPVGAATDLFEAEFPSTAEKGGGVVLDAKMPPLREPELLGRLVPPYVEVYRVASTREPITTVRMGRLYTGEVELVRKRAVGDGKSEVCARPIGEADWKSFQAIVAANGFWTNETRGAAADAEPDTVELQGARNVARGIRFRGVIATGAVRSIADRLFTLGGL